MQFPFPFFDILVIPIGAVSGTRIEIDGTTGEIRFYNSADILVGLLSPSVWWLGTEDGARAQMDPFGGFRVFSSDNILIGIFDATGLQLRDRETGIVGVGLEPHGIIRLASPDGNIMTLLANSGGVVTAPKWGGLFTLSPGTTHVTPALAPFTTTDFELRYVAAFTKAILAAQTMTPPAGYTEELDTFDANNGSSMLVSLASKQPETSNAQRTLTSTSAAWEHDAAMTLVFASDGVTPPSIRDITDAFITAQGTNEITLTLTKPTVVAGDILVAFVALENDGGSVPSSWSTPEGFKFLGAGFQFTGSGSTQSTGAAGCWYKEATADDVAATDYTVDVNIVGPAASTKKFHVTMVSVQDVDVLVGGADIRFEPASRCRVWLNGNFNLPALTLQTVPFNAESFDPGDNYSTSAFQYVVPQSGPYVLGWRMITTGAAAGERFLTRLNVNGAARSSGTDITNPTAGAAVVLTGADDLDLLAGDVLEIKVQQVNGVLRAINGANDATSFFFIQRTLST